MRALLLGQTVGGPHRRHQDQPPRVRDDLFDQDHHRRDSAGHRLDDPLPSPHHEKPDTSSAIDHAGDTRISDLGSGISSSNIYVTPLRDRDHSRDRDQHCPDRALHRVDDPNLSLHREKPDQPIATIIAIDQTASPLDHVSVVSESSTVPGPHAKEMGARPKGLQDVLPTS